MPVINADYLPNLLLRNSL